MQANFSLSNKKNTTEKNTPALSARYEYAAHWVRFLENFLGLRLSPDQVNTWIVALAEYEKWKLDLLINFRLNEEGRGRTLADVCRYLDALRPHPEYETTREDLGYKRLAEEPESKTTERVQIARDFNEHVQKVLSFTGTREERLKWEWESFKRLDEKYPHLRVKAQVENEKRFKDLR